MYDPERSWSLSFSGCGFLFPYYLGAIDCMSERAPHLLSGARHFFGSSCGSIQSVFLLGGVPLNTLVKFSGGYFRRAMSHSMGVLHPSFNPSQILREQMERYLPANIHQLISGRVFISLTRVSDWGNVLVSEFQSKDEVLDAMVCSCFIPIYCGLLPPSFRGVRYIDGAASNNTPFFDAKTTVTMSPFYGEYDICPKVKSTNFFHMEFSRSSFQFCSDNLHLLTHSLFPKNVKDFTEHCIQGYLDAARFLEENGICNRPQPCLSSSSQEPDVPVPCCETTDLRASPGLAAWPVSPKKELLDHLCHGPLPLDKSILEKMSPRLILELNRTFKKENKFMSGIRNSLPAKVMSYVMLPCTLPVDYVIAMAWRLVKWLPHGHDDIQWLYSITFQICSRVMTRLFPTYSSQMLASGQRPTHTHQSMTGTSGLPAPHAPGCPPHGLTGAGQN